MSSWSNWPSYDQFLSEAWGWPNEVTSPFFGASNVVVGTNPPYSVSDFLTVYPKFGGAPLVLTGVVTQGSATVPLDSTAGLLVGMAICPYIPIAGQFLAGLFPFGTTILSIVANTSVTLSDVALNSGAQIAVYSAPFVPLPVINIFINLASASLVQARWQASWPLGMAWFIAHFLTLWLQSDGDVYNDAGAAAQAGIQQGILVSKSAGNVSAGIQPVTGLEQWGAWTQTSYGVLFAQMARFIGAGPLFLW